MIYDSYKNFLPDSWFTKTFDDLFIKWISQRLFCLVLRSFFWCSNFCFHPELYRFLDHCFSVSSFLLSRYGLVFCYWTLSTSVTGETSGLSLECTNYIGGPGACSAGKKKLKFGLAETPYPAFRNSYVYFVSLFSETRYSWFPSRSTKIHDSYKFCNYDSWFMIHDSASTPEIERCKVNCYE